MATQKAPVGSTGGGELFSGAIANALAEQGFNVSVFGQSDPDFEFSPSVRYIDTGPTADTIKSEDKVSDRQAVNETAIAAPLILEEEIEKSPSDRQWVVLDNDTASMPAARYLRKEHIPQLFIQHGKMTPNKFRVYDKMRALGGKVVAIADYQREYVTTNFGPLHDATIKNGVDTRGFTNVLPKLHQPGEPINVITLSRIEPGDTKGTWLAAKVVERLRKEHDAHLTIAGPISGRDTYEAMVAPHLGECVSYAGAVTGQGKADYIANAHVGAAFSNPGGWDGQKFTLGFEEGNSLTLHEMIYFGTMPISTDSGGAEPMRDAGLSEFIVPLDTISVHGLDTFIGLAADNILKAAYHSIGLNVLRSKARTMHNVGADYREYIMDLLDADKNTIF
jgi:hypothetical protein